MAIMPGVVIAVDSSTQNRYSLNEVRSGRVAIRLGERWYPGVTGAGRATPSRLVVAGWWASMVTFGGTIRCGGYVGRNTFVRMRSLIDLVRDRRGWRRAAGQAEWLRSCRPRCWMVHFSSVHHRTGQILWY